MRAVDIIIKKRDRQELSQDELEFFIRGYALGEIPDYQAAAWAMAVLINGMTPQETTHLTLAMAYSGKTVDYSSLSKKIPTVVDKHSTGGVGDKTTLVVEPVVAACGLPVGKMSGHNLGFSGGTLDKLESIPGYRTNLTIEEFLKQLETVGLVLTGQSADLAPADGKLYALRDVTGTIQSIPLIASSVMSKKIAAGAQAIVLDVKVGVGSFMPDLPQARRLSELMVSIAKMVGRRAVALLSDMNQPLGNAVGNTLELREAIQTLHGGGPADFREHCLTVASHMLSLGEACSDEEQGRHMAEEVLGNGEAWMKFRALVTAQGGEVAYIDHPDLLPGARLIDVIPAPRSGYLAGIHARLVGEGSVLLGAGRNRKGDRVDHAVGVLIYHKVGDWVAEGQPLCTVHANDEGKLSEARKILLQAHTWSDTQVKPLPLFYDVIRG